MDKLLCKRQAACARGKTGLLVCVVCCFSVENVNVGHGLHGQVGLCLHMGGEVLDGLCCWEYADQIGEVALAWAKPSTCWCIDEGSMLGQLHGLPDKEQGIWWAETCVAGYAHPSN